MMLLALVAPLVLSACGECPCKSANKDYLRDVPVTRSQSFR